MFKSMLYKGPLHTAMYLSINVYLYSKISSTVKKFIPEEIIIQTYLEIDIKNI